MSLSVDGVWKAGTWVTTAWADGVWREGAPAVQALPDSPQYYGLMAPPERPLSPQRLSERPFDPQVDVNFESMARMAEAQAYLGDVVDWIERELGESEEYVDVFAMEGLEAESDLTGKNQWRRIRS